MRLTRALMLEVLRQDYIRTAWSKGMREPHVSCCGTPSRTLSSPW